MGNENNRVQNNTFTVIAAINSIDTHGRQYYRNERVVLGKNKKKNENQIRERGPQRFPETDRKRARRKLPLRFRSGASLASDCWSIPFGCRRGEPGRLSEKGAF